jgi:hypothetical protein
LAALESIVIVLMRMPVLQDFPQPVHRNLVSAIAGNRRSPIWNRRPLHLGGHTLCGFENLAEPSSLAEPVALELTPAFGRASGLQRLAVVVIMRERMIPQANHMGREYGNQ